MSQPLTPGGGKRRQLKPFIFYLLVKKNVCVTTNNKCKGLYPMGTTCCSESVCCYDCMRLTPITNIHSVRVFCLFVFHPDTNNTCHDHNKSSGFFFGGGGGGIFLNFPSNVNYTLTSNNDRWPYWLCSPSFCLCHWLKKLTALYFHQSAIVW